MMASPASSDEGEIRDGDVVDKANKTLPQYDGTSVDRPDRTRGHEASKSPDHDYDRARDRRSRDRSRSPYYERQSRGAKRSRDEEYPDRSRDPRRFKVHYENSSQNHRHRSRISYEDIDSGSTTTPELRYDDNDRQPYKRPRTRSRSPYRTSRHDDRSGRGDPGRGGRELEYTEGRGMHSHGHSDRRGREYKDQSVSKRGTNPLPADTSRHDAKSTKGSSHDHVQSSSRSDALQQPNVATLTIEEPEAEPVDEATLIEERRKRREAIKAKYKATSTPLLVQALQAGPSGASTPGQNIDSSRTSVGPASPLTSTPGTPVDFTDPSSPSAFTINNDQDLANNKGDPNSGDEDGPSAADYDPTGDMREDKQRDEHRHDEVPATAYDEKAVVAKQDIILPSKEVEAPVKAKDEFDMFAEDDDDDMFAEDSRNTNGNAAVEPSGVAVPIPEARELDIGMLDNWDDPEGYYKIILGELLDSRYHVQANLGQGMFSGVVRAMDIKTKKLVAIKLIRNNETMRKAGYKEIEILQKLKDADLEDKKHMIRLERSFEHKGHLCMVFEHLSINLREVLKKFGRDVGINLRAVRAYAQQMFLGLSLMRKCNILHADLKPDNILVNEGRNLLKICDLGSASDASDNEITPYLVSRFYRAPEIILGMPYDFAIDVWSVGCTLYEMYTGKILFTGRTNNQMLRSIMDCRGKFTIKMLKRAQFAHVHFDEMANFRSVEQDKLTGKDIVKTLTFAKPSRDLRTRLMSASKGLTEVETKELALFVDLLDRCLALNPEKRCTPAEALKHPFLTRTGRSY